MLGSSTEPCTALCSYQTMRPGPPEKSCCSVVSSLANVRMPLVSSVLQTIEIAALVLCCVHRMLRFCNYCNLLFGFKRPGSFATGAQMSKPAEGAVRSGACACIDTRADKAVTPEGSKRCTFFRFLMVCINHCGPRIEARSLKQLSIYSDSVVLHPPGTFLKWRGVLARRAWSPGC